MYKCEICGKEWPSIVERAKCETACSKRLQEEAKKAAETKKKEEHDTRRAEVDMAIDKASKLLNEYVKDYGTYKYNGRTNFSDDDPSLYKLLQYFLF